MLEKGQCAYRSIREVQGRRVRQNTQMYKLLTQNIQARCLVWYFHPRIIPGTSHKLRSFRAGPYRVTKLIPSALAEIKTVYYPGEERLLSLDVLKLYRGKDVIFQNPEDIDPYQWLDEGELMELPEVRRMEAEEMLGKDGKAPVTSETDNGPYLEIPMVPEEP